MVLPSLLEEALESWRYVRQGVIDEVQNLPQDAMASRAVGARTIGEIVHHIAQAGLVMSGELTRKDGDFLRQSPPAFLQEYAGGMEHPILKSELIALLQRTLQQGEQRFSDAGEALLLAPIRQFNGKSARRLTWMYHGISHENYHRGQIALAARLLGHVPALTRRIHGE